MNQTVTDLTIVSRCGFLYRSQHLEELGLTAQQASSLLFICNEPGISQDQLAHRVMRSKSNITRQLTTLEKNGLVKRKISPTDRRVMELHPTERSLELLPKIIAIRNDWQEYLLQAISPEDHEALKRILAQLKVRSMDWVEAHRNE